MEEKPKAEVRRRALLHALVSGVVAALLIVLLFTLRGLGVNPRRGLVLATAVPAAWFLVQIAVLVTGVPYITMARKWDSLGGGQKFVFAIVILAVAFVILGGIAFAVAMLLIAP